MSLEEVQEIIVVDRAAKEKTIEIARQNGVEVKEVAARGFEPVATITLVLMGASLAVGTVLHLIDREKGGQIIDLRPSSPRQFYRSTEVLFGLIVIIAPDGNVTVEVKEPQGMFGQVVFALKETLPEVSSPKSKELAELVAEKIGSQVVVTTEVTSE